MPIKKKLEAVPKKWYQKITPNQIGLGLVAITVICTVFCAYKATKAVEKNEVNNYVCKVVGSNPDEDVLALQCLTK